MAVTATAVSKHTVMPGVGLMKLYTVLGDTSFLGTGEAIDLTADFSEIHAAWACGTDAIADNVYEYSFVVPGAGTALTSANFLLVATQSPAKTGATEAAEAFEVATSADLSGVGALAFMVVGKAIT